MNALIKRIEILSFIPFLTLAVAIGLPLSKSKSDMWDGTIIRYAADTHDFAGLKHWFFESNYQLQYLLIRLESEISLWLRMSFHSINFVTILLAMILIVSQTRYLAEKVFGLPREMAIFAACLVSVMPMWNTLVSSVLTFHVLALGVGLLGFRLLLKDSTIFKVGGLILCCLTYQLNSMLVFLPALAFVTYLMRNDSNKRESLPKIAFSLFASGLLYFSSIKIFHNSTGPYADYNKFINPFSPSGVASIAFNTKSFMSFLLIPLIGAIVFGLSIIVLRESKTRILRMSNFRKSENYLLLLLMALSVFPYIAVGKSADIREFSDWSGRQGFTLVVPLAIFTASLMNSLFDLKSVKNGGASRWLPVTALLTLMAISFISLTGFATKISRQDFERDLQTTLIAKIAEPLPGTVQIFGEGIPGPGFREYESNYFLSRTYEKILWWTRIGENKDDKFEIPTYITASLPTSTYLFERRNLNCSTLIRINAQGYLGVFSSMQNYFGIFNERTIRMLDVKKSC